MRPSYTEIASAQANVALTQDYLSRIMTSMDPESIRIDIERRAEKLNLSPAKLCQYAGIPFSTFWRWQKGADPRLSTVKVLCDKLDELEAS